MARPLGSVNKRRQSFFQAVKAENFDPFIFLLKVAEGDWKACGYDSPTVTKYTAEGAPYQVERITIENRISAAQQACRYLYPQLRAISVQVNEQQEKVLKDIEQLKSIPQPELVQMIENKLSELKKT